MAATWLLHGRIHLFSVRPPGGQRLLFDVGRRCDQTMTDVVMRLRCTGVSMFDVDFAGYEHILGGNSESKSASRSVGQDSNAWDPVVWIEVTGRWVAAS